MSSVRIRLFQTESFRHAALFVALFACSMAVLIVIVYAIMDHSFKANLMRETDDDLTSIRTAYHAALPKHKGEHEAKEMIDDRMLAPDSDDVFLLQRDGVRVAGNLPPMAPRQGVFTLRYPRSFGGRAGNVEHVILGQGILLNKDLYAFVGQDLYAAKQSERGILFVFGWVMLASLVLASLSGLLLGRSFLRRVDTITETCRSIMAGRLGDRIPATGTRNELERLGSAINAMLDRIQTLMESLRQVSSDIAHDLRTPLTHLRYRLEQAHNAATTTEDYAGAVDAAIADCDQLLSIFTALLRIAQIEAGARRAEFQDVSLAQLVERARDIYKPVMDDAGHPFEASADATAAVRGDPQLLLQLFSNLLDNAITHTPRGAQVSLKSGMNGDRPVIVVADSGPGIPEGDRDAVFRRFYRREQSRTTPGSGLGLSLALAIAELHGATIVLGDNKPGLRAMVAFPARAA
jgi:signal transduction histidine kinase